MHEQWFKILMWIFRSQEVVKIGRFIVQNKFVFSRKGRNKFILSLVYPYLLYAIVFWAELMCFAITTDKNYVNPVQPYIGHNDPLFQSAAIFKLNVTHLYQLTLHALKVKSLVRFTPINHNYLTGNRANLYQPFSTCGSLITRCLLPPEGVEWQPSIS